MKALAREGLVGCGFVAIGIIVALGVLLVDHVQATHELDLSYVYRGMIPFDDQYCASWAGDDEQIDGWQACWHDDEAGEYSAIDYNWGPLADSDAGNAVRLMYTGDFEHFRFEELPPGSTCKGLAAALYWKYITPGYRKGDLHYLHVDVDEGVIGVIAPSQGYYFGSVASEENCPWTHPHLHQSADISATTPFYSNKYRDPSQDDNWQHAVLWEPGSADSDNDDFTNQDELYIDTDPFDDCADNSSDSAWPPDLDNNTVVDNTDALTFLNTFPSCEVSGPPYATRYDFVPDGCIDVSDALLFLGYFPSTCA